MIDWKPIAELPDDATNGRDLLFWWDDEAVVVSYTRGQWHLAWAEQSDVKIEQFSYFAEINPPHPF